LPIISLPSQGDRLPGLVGPLLLLVLLPLGFLMVRQFRTLRDPSWRLLTGIGAALLTRAIVSSVPEEGTLGLAIWLGRGVIPAAIGVGLWWRGGALCVAELTPGEVRGEFSVLALCALGTLALVRPFVLADQVLLGAAVGLVAVGGLLATTFARQDAAEAVGSGSERALGATTALAPVAIAVVLASVLQPALLGAMWTTLARVIELALTPLGWLLAWLASLLPRGPAVPPPPLLPPRPIPDFAPDPAALAELQDRAGWIGTVVLVALILMAGLAAMLAVHLMLANWIRDPAARAEPRGPAVTVERTGTPRADAQALLGWLFIWLRRGLRPRSRHRPSQASGAGPAEPATADAWTAYQRLLDWAALQGQARRPAETTGQLQARLGRHAPEAIDALDIVTSTYEADRYGSIPAPPDRLKHLRAALTIFGRPRG
jgi:hypothetical protein